MAESFIGESDHKIDTKGRVAIPAAFRDVLAAEDPKWVKDAPLRMVVVFGNIKVDYLECYTINAYAQIKAQIALMQRGSKPRKALERMYITMAQEMTLDPTGRIVLGERMRQKADLTDKAWFAGVGDAFHIMNEATYQAQMDDLEDLLDDLDDDVDPLTLLPPLPGPDGSGG